VESALIYCIMNTLQGAARRYEQALFIQQASTKAH
jgi:hypothetical protein